MLFEQQQFPETATVVGKLLIEHPHDGPSLLLMSRDFDALLHRGHRVELV